MDRCSILALAHRAVAHMVGAVDSREEVVAVGDREILELRTWRAGQ
jgi:hypothetical protein